MTARKISSHIRYNPLSGARILVCPERGSRPRSEKEEPPPPPSDSEYDPTCYLCPGNIRATGNVNPAYTSVFAFDNDYPALVPHTSGFRNCEGALIQSHAEDGICRVLCYSPRHDLTPARLPEAQLRRAVDTWTEESATLSAVPWIGYVQIFENHGAIGGASSRHPHSQIWASADIPDLVKSEDFHQEQYALRYGTCLLCDYVKLELTLRERVVCENDGFVVLVPYWAVWPFETMVLSKRHLADVTSLTAGERGLFADIIKRITTRYDNLFQMQFPYSMAIHQKPADDSVHTGWHFHAHYFSPMRSATIQKVMAAYELGAGSERDGLPEEAALRLRVASETHYLPSKS